ncbi:helix-turn-helix transcriptional regulator [Rhodoferax saidenbachensis]|uniref:Transcriptional regulator with XRE-family HTH domain n=1 Tax=Rhodoferax saidenbachensis TaxID=1484693 RepID=A0ABU1ZPG9_9BURK|nr:helix-turn-helix transcriptional regulator [Rhodoferax saidenbachensis]MDR7307442.1 transcriptional regulator with XRE-family HTH domain [Rhodoferax saidenbachensis]
MTKILYMPTSPNLIGPQLRALRIAQGKSQMDVAKAAGISRTTLIQIEKGMDAQMSSYQAVAEELGMALGLGGESPELAERRKARQENQAKLAASREKHLKIAALMALDDAPAREMKSQALQMVALWKERDLCSPVYIERWTQILQAEPKELARNILAMDEDWGPALRQNTPFALTLP